MKVIELQYPNHVDNIVNEPVVLVLGYFDGVHKGHQQVIKTAKKIADERGIKLALMSFNHHPSIVFSNHANWDMLTTLDDKGALFEQLGVDIFYVVSFTSLFASLTPEQFEKQFLEQLHAQVVVAGFDYQYGCQAKGTIQELSEKQTPFDVVVVEKLACHHQKISSTNVKKALEVGDLKTVTQFLGRYYCTKGIVVHGQARGRTIGFPTANVQHNAQYYLPKEGVYAVKICIQGQWYNGMASIGRNITFEDNRPITIEVNVFEFSQMIYGEQVAVEWCHYLRDEVKFNSVDDLIEQLKQDEVNAKLLLNDIKNP